MQSSHCGLGLTGEVCVDGHSRIVGSRNKFCECNPLGLSVVVELNEASCICYIHIVSPNSESSRYTRKNVG